MYTRRKPKAYGWLAGLMLLIAFSGLTGFSHPAVAKEQAFLDRDDVRQYIEELVARHGFERNTLQTLFSMIQPRPDIIRAITNPAEAKPWYLYRPIFIQESRIRGGVKFWNRHQALLARAEAEYGVPAEIIVAILGVETRYGHYTGRHGVLESLATLAFDYPPRSRFFRSELTQFLLLTREEGVDPLSLKGSYAGAMGMPQFISSSYRRYAVDFDGDGHRDLHRSIADVIGSVANYFKLHGWQRGGPIAVPARLKPDARVADILNRLKPALRLSQLAQRGVEPAQAVAGDPQAALIALALKQGREYWLGFNNFYVITRYNHSPLYAMAVLQLAELIKLRRQGVDDTQRI